MKNQDYFNSGQKIKLHKKERFLLKYVMRCAIWFHLYNFKNMKNIHGGVLILVKLQGKVCNFTKINTPPWVFFTFFKLCKCDQIAQRITFRTLPEIYGGAILRK